MDRSRENSVLLSTKVKSFEPNATNPRQIAHEAVATKAIRRQLKAFPPQSNSENNPNTTGFSSNEGLLGRNSEQFVSPLQAQYFAPTVPGTALGMSMPYVGGMITAAGMDPRTLNAGNLLYTYGAPVMSFPNFPGGYAQIPRGKGIEDTAGVDKNSSSSASLRSMEMSSWGPKEPVRTESVIKTVSDRHEPSKKPNDADSRSHCDTQSVNSSMRYSNRESDVGKVDDRKTKTALGDGQSEMDMSHRDKYAVQGDATDHSWDKALKAKAFDHLGVDSSSSKRSKNGSASRTNENGVLTFSSLGKSYTSSESRASPYRSEPPTLYPYHSTVPSRASPSMTSSNVPASMPKLTPIAPRLNNGSPLTLPSSSESERRSSLPVGSWRHNYSYPSNSVTGLPQTGQVPWTTSYYERPTHGNKADENSAWRTKHAASDEREIDRTSGYENTQNAQQARHFYPPQSWDRHSNFSTLSQQLRTADAEKGFGGKDVEDDTRGLARASPRDSATSSEQMQANFGKDFMKFGAEPVSLRKEPDMTNTKHSANVNQEDIQRNQNLTYKSEKSVVGGYVRYNSNDDGKGTLGNVIVHGKAGSYKVSVERRGDKQKYLDCIANGRQTSESVKHSRSEEKDRSFSGNYGDYERREQNDSWNMSVTRPGFRTFKEVRERESSDRSRTVDTSRYKDQISFKEYTGRKSDTRELSSVVDMRSLNDRNNNNNISSNSGSSNGYSYWKMHGTSSVTSPDQARYSKHSSVKDDRVFVPPNATIEMYEKREQEMERNGARKADFNSYAKSVESGRTTNLLDSVARKNDERQWTLKREDARSKGPSERFENSKGKEAEEISSDENDDEPKIISTESASVDKRGQSRRNLPSDRLSRVSPQSAPVRQRRFSSPVTEQRNVPVSSAYDGAAFNAALQGRRVPDVRGESSSRDFSRDASLETAATGLGIPTSAPFLRMGMDGSALSSPYFSQFMAAPPGRPDAPLLLLDPYGGMYRPHMMEAASQGIFPQGAFAADPMATPIMMVPEAYFPMMAESQFLLDPRFSGAWGLAGALDESQLQQFYQMMQPFQKQQQQQQQHQKEQESERGKQEFMGQHGGAFPWSGYPFYFGKHFEPQRKDDKNEGKSLGQQQHKEREERAEHSESNSKETAPKPKTETSTSQESISRPVAPRDESDRSQQQETPDRRGQKTFDSNWLKETHQKLSEKHSAIQAQLDAQGKIAEQLKDYLSRDPLSQFSFSAPQKAFISDSTAANATATVTATSGRTTEVSLKSASPKTVSAAVTLSGLELARDNEQQRTARQPSPVNVRTDYSVVSERSSGVERAKSPRLRPGMELTEAFEKSSVSKEIAETPRRLEAQPDLAGERPVSRERRQVPLQYHEGLLSFGHIASERVAKEKSERELGRGDIENSFYAFNRVPPISYGDASRHVPIQTVALDSRTDTNDREQNQRTQVEPQFDSEEIESEIYPPSENVTKERVGLRDTEESWEVSRGSLPFISSEKLSSPGQLDSDSDFDDDFNTKRELRSITSSFLPLRPDLENKENSGIFSLRPIRSEAERKQIRDNIDRLRSMAKRRNSKERFMVFTRRRDLRSPTTILNSVTSSISDVAGVESVEKEMRVKLAELQKKYREKARELARLQPKCREGNEDGSGKSTPVKRGPGRPRKRKYFGASSKMGKPSPPRSSSPPAEESKEGEDSRTPSGAQSPNVNCGTSEPESLVPKESGPPKKKKKTKQNSYVEQEEGSTRPPSRGFGPGDFVDFQIPTGKKKKSSKLSTSEEGSAPAISKNKQQSGGKKKGLGVVKRRKGSSASAVDETSTSELESNIDVSAPVEASETASDKKPRPKKRARPKLTLETSESFDVDVSEEMPLDSASAICETPRAPTPVKSKKAKFVNKKRKCKPPTPTKGKFEFADAAVREDSFSGNSVSPNEIAKEVVAIAARKQQEAQENNRETSSDDDDDVFASSLDGPDGLSLLATFATAKKSTAKRKRSEGAVSTDEQSSKKRGRPKKPMESPPFDLDVPVTPKKKKKKKVLEQDPTKEPKKKKKKKNIQPVEDNDKKLPEPEEEKEAEQMTVVDQVSEHPVEPLESPPESLPTNIGDSEPEENDVYQSIEDLNKESRRNRSDTTALREADDSKMNVSSLLCDEWQPRRSERIFINSSVTTNSSTSPLSPTGKAYEFPWTKKPKKVPGSKPKSSKSGSQGEEDAGEIDVTTAPKLKGKTKKKKGFGKGKKRSPSTTANADDYESLRISKRSRSKSRLTNDFFEGDEDGDELQEDEDDLADEGDVDAEEIHASDKTQREEEREEDHNMQEVDMEQENAQETDEQEKRDKEKDEEHGEPCTGEGDQDTNESNDKEETSNVNTVDDKPESSDDADSRKVTSQDEERNKMEAEKEPRFQSPESPRDMRFTFLVEELVVGTKLLLPVDSVFYRGHISTFNEPDLFGVVLDGERGRRPHWRSTEQMLTQAIRDIQPPSVKVLPIGTRVCAHWSPQYRCFYPGSVTEAPPDEKEEGGKVWIEFDDGDSGLFQLDEIKRIHPSFPVEEAESTPPLPEKRPRTTTLGAASTSLTKNPRSRIRSEEITSELSSGNESSGEIQTKRQRRLRGKKKGKDEMWMPTKLVDSYLAERSKNAVETRSNTDKDCKSSALRTETLTIQEDFINIESKGSKGSAPSKQTGIKVRTKTETSASDRTMEQAKLDMAAVPSAELKQSENEIHLHSSATLQKTEVFEADTKRTSEKLRGVTDTAVESSDQGEDSEAASDVEVSKHEKGTRASNKGSSRTSDKDLRRRSLTLNINSAFRASRTSGGSPTCDNLSTSQDEDSESYSDTFDESPLVENKVFQPRLGRRRRSELDRLQADIKSSGPLWHWSGKNFQNKRKGKGKKVFYKAIVRGDETIFVGDCAVFMSNPTKNLNLPYVGKIESMWEGCSGNMVVRVKWFYHPEETKPGRRPSDGKHSLYRSTHVDENDVQTISHKCEVLTPEEFKRRLQSQESPGTRASLSDRVFCCIGSYDPNNETLQTEL